MTKVIWKYRLELVDQFELRIPIVYNILSAGIDPAGQLCIWVEVDNEEVISKFVSIFVVGTGNPIPAKAKDFIGTVLFDPFMWHIYAEHRSSSNG